jgi:hypothetical protein
VLPSEDRQPASPDLPRDELNPATNPLLGQNLGRWADAYFTSPPDKREQAVMDLLRELTVQETARASPVVSRVHNIPKAGAACARCRHLNQSSSRFCGRCGEELLSDRSGSTWNADEPSPEQRTGASSKQGTSAEPEAGAAKTEEATDPAPVPVIPTGAPAARRIRWTLGHAAIAVAIILAGLSLWRWMSERRSPANGSVVPPTAVTVARQKPNPSVQSHRSARPQKLAMDPGKPTQAPRVHSGATSGEQSSGTTAAGGVIPLSSRTSLLTDSTRSNSSRVPEIGPGMHDFVRAKSLLSGKNGSRDASEAAKWLWKAVAKGNAGAAILLANLYVSGDGVPRSCDQARLLLAAAARDSAAAAGELHRLETSGCQ